MKARKGLFKILLLASMTFSRLHLAYAETCEETKLRVEAADPDTTFVCEDPATLGGGGSPGAGGDGTGNDTGTSTGTGGGGGGHGGHSVVHVGPPEVVQPEDFSFKKCPGNSMSSFCTAIRFVGGSPPAMVDVGVTVNAPFIRADGKQLSTREAQLDSANSATGTAHFFLGLLKAGALSPSEVAARFSKQMDTNMRISGVGYRVQRCNPVANPPPPC